MKKYLATLLLVSSLIYAIDSVHYDWHKNTITAKNTSEYKGRNVQTTLIKYVNMDEFGIIIDIEDSTGRCARIASNTGYVKDLRVNPRVIPGLKKKIAQFEEDCHKSD